MKRRIFPAGLASAGIARPVLAEDFSLLILKRPSFRFVMKSGRHGTVQLH